MWPNTGVDVKWGDQPCGACDQVPDQHGLCACKYDPVPLPRSKNVTPVKKSKTARGFKGLKKVAIADVAVHSSNQVMLVTSTGKTYFMIEASVVDGEAVLKCSKHKVVVKHKRSTAQLTSKIDKFA